MLTAEDEKMLVKAAQDGDKKALNTLIDQHRPIIERLAKKHGKRLDSEDAMSEGIVGFIKGLNRYNPKYGVRLNTYVRHWVEEEVRDALLSSATIKLPRSEKTRDGLKAFKDLKKRKIDPTAEALMREHKVNKKDAIQIIAMAMHTQKNTYVEIEQAEEIEDLSENVEDVIELKMRRALIHKAAERLNDREKYIFHNRTATNDEPLTLKEISQKYNVTQERIRQIEIRLMRRFMHGLTLMGFEPANAS